MTTATATLPIPPILLQSWRLPEGWENHITIQVYERYLQGQADDLALAWKLDGREWAFTVPTDWVPWPVDTQEFAVVMGLGRFREALEKIAEDAQERASPGGGVR